MRDVRTWPVGPLCLYWAPEGEDAPICGHGSCYQIAADNNYEFEGDVLT